MEELFGKKILIIEDDSGLRKLEEKILGRYFKVIAKANGKEALSWLKSNKPDLIITDLDMPDINGIQFLKNLRSSLFLRKINTIVISGYDEMDYRKICAQYGISHYMVKPFNPIELILKVFELFNLTVKGNNRMESIRSLVE